jgi:pentatricopeptide repeat protein
VAAEIAAMAPGTVQLNIFAWNQKFSKYAKDGKPEKVIQLFQQMQLEGISPDKFTFVPVIKACAGLGALEDGRLVHKQLIQSGFESDVFVGSSLVDMYAKCGSIKDAWRVFNKMSSRNVVTWTAMILGHVKCGQGQKALELYQQMQQEGVQPDSVTFVGVLNACASLAALKDGRLVHQQIVERGWDADVFVGNSLVDMYAKCGSMEDALRVFNKMPSRDVVTWTAMILGYVQCWQGQKALELFQQMQQEGVRPDSVTFVAVLNACASVIALEEGRSVHVQIIQNGLDSEVFVGSSLVDMYAKCGSIEEACRVFSKMPSRDVVTWNAMVLGHVKCGQGQKALELFRQMQQEGVQPDSVTFVAALNACASVAALEEGRCVHHQIIQSCLESDVFVGSSLVDMYAKCGNIEDAWRVFNKMPSRNVVTWNAMVLGLVKCGQGQKALELFQQMQQEGVQPNSVTFVGVLNACASMIALEEGRCVHQHIIRCGWDSDIFVGSSLVDMYAKCGSMEDAWSVFNKMPSRDVVTWTAILGGCAMHGHGKEALKHFEQMCEEGVQPDDVTFICLLSACSHAGLVGEGMHCYASMVKDYMISAKLEHYTCMVDLLGRAGHLQEAENMVMAMPCKPHVAVWMALLSACRIHGHVEMAERIAKQILELEPDNAAVYVLLSDIYAAGGNKHLCQTIEQQRKEKGVNKQPGRTWIEVNNEVHTFVVDDQDHPQMPEIHAELQRLSGHMHDAGYRPCKKFIMHDVDEEEKVFRLCHHSEKLAIAFGLINSAPGTPLRIRKNLRVCEDCHTSTKFISKIAGRTIMVRDANRFHHFEDGVCSCRDYW